MAANAPKEFQNFAQEIEKLDIEINALQLFHTGMKSSENVFFSEEVASVDNRLSQLTKAREEQAKELQERVRVYEDEILHLQSTIAAREKILETQDSNGVLKSNPELMQLFAKGHVHLQKQLDTLCSRVGMHN